MFIGLEGIDNAGKTTLAEKLANDLRDRNINVNISKELTTSVGKIVVDAFRTGVCLTSEQKTLLFAADRLARYQELQNRQSDVVIWDRYIYSAFVYREMEGCDLAWVKVVNSIFPQADLNIYLDVDIEESVRRGYAANKPCPYTKQQLQICQNIYRQYILSGDLICYNSIEHYSDILELIIKKINER